MGPVHDNRCPTPGCEARFSSYAEYQDHATQHGHLGFKCGWCDEVFETMGKSIQCCISKQVFSKIIFGNYLMVLIHSVKISVFFYHQIFCKIYFGE